MGLRHVVTLATAIVLLAGGIPFLTCAPALCATSPQCAVVHCSCCDPSCSWPGHSHDSQKRTTASCEVCPLIATSNTVTLSRAQQLAAAITPPIQLQPFLAQASYHFCSLGQPAFLLPPTLLILGCPFTV